LCAAALAGLAVLCAGPVHGHDAHAHPKMPQVTVKPGAVKVRGLDTTLLDQEGRRVHLGREVIGDKIVVVNFVYTTCTTVCPLASALFADLQGRLGDALGREVVLVTLTVDPVRDTPAVLKAQASRYGARDGWTWLTGPSVAVNEVLRGMGAYTSDFTQHPLMVLVGDGAQGTWTRLAGTPDPARLALHVKALQQARAAKAGG
jgi:protein SCO1/2